jgi:hypothetical protein
MLNLSLTFASIVVGYLVMEVVFLRLALPWLPSNLRAHLPDLSRVLVQSSKKHYLPRDYIALLGDSNAEGLGDWLLAAGGDGAKPFHSAHIIHAITGRDVVSFGKGPAGSAEGLVLRPARILARQNCYLFPSLENPRQILYYFTENNDIEDNLFFLQRVAATYRNVDQSAIERYLREHSARPSSWQCHVHLAGTFFRMGQFIYYRYVRGMDFIRAVAYGINIAGRTYYAHALNGPALGLSNEEIERALTLFPPSLSWLRQRFAEVPVSVVYIPSPLTVYGDAIQANVAPWHATPQLTFAVADPGGVPPSALARETSDFLCNRIRKMALAQSAGFIDATSALRSAASRQPVHGPVDWNHLNEAGYRALGQLVARHLEQGNPKDSCANRH